MSLLVKGLVILAFLGLVMGVFKFMIFAAVMPTGIHTGFQYVVDASFWANRYLPIDTALTIYAAYLLTEVSIWLFRNGTKIIGYAARLLG